MSTSGPSPYYDCILHPPDTGFEHTSPLLQGFFPELEKNQIVRRLRVARDRARTANGKCEGRKGYADSPEGRALVHKIRLLRRNPKRGPRPTWKQIADRLNREGIKTLDGNTWTLYRVQQTASSGGNRQSFGCRMRANERQTNRVPDQSPN